MKYDDSRGACAAAASRSALSAAVWMASCLTLCAAAPSTDDDAAIATPYVPYLGGAQSPWMPIREEAVKTAPTPTTPMIDSRSTGAPGATGPVATQPFTTGPAATSPNEPSSGASISIGDGLLAPPVVVPPLIDAGALVPVMLPEARAPEPSPPAVQSIGPGELQAVTIGPSSTIEDVMSRATVQSQPPSDDVAAPMARKPTNDKSTATVASQEQKIEKKPAKNIVAPAVQTMIVDDASTRAEIRSPVRVSTTTAPPATKRPAAGASIHLPQTPIPLPE